MIFEETRLKGAYIIKPEPRQDERGFFSRMFCKTEFSNAGLETEFVQSNLSLSKEIYTLRGMHFQVNGSEEVKLVRCAKGQVQDVIVDLRPSSPTFKQHTSIILTEGNLWQLYVPHGFAHGFITLEENSALSYMVSNYYSNVNERGVRWNDPAFEIEWMHEPSIISEKDEKHQDFNLNILR